MSENKAPARDLTVKKQFDLRGFLLSWEMILVYLLLAVNVVLMILRPNYYFSAATLPSIIQSGMDLSFMVLGMVFILMLGDIDVSVAATMILSAMVMGLLRDAGAHDILVILGGLATGAACGLFNGVLVAKAKMPAVIVTIATSLLFRGIAKIVMNVNTLKNFPSWFSALGWGNIGGIVPISLVCFLAGAVIFGLILHRSRFGRELYIIGNSETVARYSGIRVDRIRILVFVIMGLMAAVASLFFVGRMAGVSSTMAKGYELDVIAIAVLGGVSTNGGKGRMYGPVISTLIMAFLFYTMGLLGVDANTRKIVTGVILIIAVLIPRINRETMAAFRLKWQFAGNKNIEALVLKTEREVRELKEEIRKIRADKSLPAIEKEAKVGELSEKIASLKNRCRKTVAEMKAETAADAKMAKERFSK